MSYENPAPTEFDLLMALAQTEHARGDYITAQACWRDAAGVAPDPLEAGRAIRGDAASSSRLGEHEYARERGEEALAIHTTAAAISPGKEKIRSLRERAQSATELGRIMLVPTILSEATGEITRTRAQEKAQPALLHLEKANRTLLLVEAIIDQTDQYSVNLASRLAVGHALYGSARSAWRTSILSICLGLQSESPTFLSNTADISESYKLRAKVRGLGRGLGALAVTGFRMIPSARKQALAIASNQYIGL